MAALVRARALNGFEAAVRRLGGDPASLLRSVGLDERDLADPARWISFTAWLRLLETTSRRLDDPGFGVRLGRARDLAYLGPLLLVAQHSETLADGLHSVSRYLSIQNNSHRTAFVVGPETCIRTYEMATELRRLANQFIETSLVSTQRLVSLILGEDAPVLWYAVRHAPLRSCETYLEEMGAPVRFNQDLDGVVFDRSIAERPIPNRDPHMQRFVLDYLDERARPATGEVVSATRNLIETLIPRGEAKIETVAAQLALHPRTLQRRLSDHGWSFSRLLEDHRRAMAERLLREGALSLSSVAGSLGYAEQSAFNHAFERWHGVSPTRWARQAG